MFHLQKRSLENQKNKRNIHKNIKNHHRKLRKTEHKIIKHTRTDRMKEISNYEHDKATNQTF